MTRAEAYLHASFYPDPSNRLATIHQRHRQTGHTTRPDRQRSSCIERTVCNTVRPMLWDCCPVLSDCEVGLLWPNSWTDQGETWHAGRPRPRSDYVRRGPKRGRAPQFSAHNYCGQTTGCIKMPVGMEVGLGPGHIVLHGDPALPPHKRGAQPPIFGPYLLWQNGWMDQNVTWCGGRPRPLATSS